MSPHRKRVSLTTRFRDGIFLSPRWDRGRNSCERPAARGAPRLTGSMRGNLPLLKDACQEESRAVEISHFIFYVWKSEQ